MGRICALKTRLRHGILAMGQRAVIAFLLAASYGCAAPSPPGGAAVVSPQPAAGQARIWVYREYEPGQSLARPYVRINGQILGISEPGGSFYRDVQPGSYSLTVDSTGRDVYQFADVNLAAGQTVFIKVEVSRLWESDLNYTADTFYTRVIPAQAATAELRRSRFYGGN